MILIATAIMGKFEHRHLATTACPALAGQAILDGALWGFVMLSFIVALMAATHSYSAGGWRSPPATSVKYWAFFGQSAFLLVGLFEEFLFRGYMLYTLTSGVGFWPAAAITCLLFAGGTSVIQAKIGLACLRLF